VNPLTAALAALIRRGQEAATWCGWSRNTGLHRARCEHGRRRHVGEALAAQQAEQQTLLGVRER